MKHLVLTLLIMPFLGTQLVAASDDEETVLRHLKKQLWPQAYREQNADLLDSILHPSFQMIDAKGGRSTKAEELDYVRSNPWQVKNFNYTIHRLDIYQSTFAVIDGRGETDTYSYVSSNYLIKEQGKWRAIASHVSGFTPKTP